MSGLDDGYAEGDAAALRPGSRDEDTSDGFTRGGWMVPHMDQTFVAQAAAWLAEADALLLGRRTYEAACPPGRVRHLRRGNDEWSLNPKRICLR